MILASWPLRVSGLPRPRPAPRPNPRSASTGLRSSGLAGSRCTQCARAAIVRCAAHRPAVPRRAAPQPRPAGTRGPWLRCYPLLPRRRARSSCSAVMATPAFKAMAPGSRIRARSALPSTVAPEYRPMSLSTAESGLTTISSGSASPSTTRPKRRPSASSTAMKLSRSEAALCSPPGISRRSRKTSGSSLPRSR